MCYSHDSLLTHMPVPQVFKCQFSLIEHIPRVNRSFLRDLHTIEFPEWMNHSLVDILHCPVPASASVYSWWLLSGFLTLGGLYPGLRSHLVASTPATSSAPSASWETDVPLPLQWLPLYWLSSLMAFYLYRTGILCFL